MGYKVIQWATGAMGKTCLRGVVDRPDLELVGVYVYGDRKNGLDAGDILRREKVGVTATNNIDEILSLDADVVIHAARLQPPYDGHDDGICRLLEAGMNVISINGNTFPGHWPESRQKRIAEAGKKGNASFMGAGLNPGFAAEKLTTAATGICLGVEKVTISETVLCHEMRSPEYVFDLLGFGSVPGEIDPNANDWAPGALLNDMFEEVVACVADRMCLPLDAIERDHRMLPAKEDLTIAAGEIKKGTVSHLDWCWRGVVDGAPVINLEIAWVMNAAHLDLSPDDLWRIRIDGTPTVNIALGLEAPAGFEGRTSVEQLAVAGSVLNSIPFVVDAAPGPVATLPSTPWQKPVS
ncbi:hypothetical protein [Hyphococcus sp. DH-69]|uniref:NAD(P)H-dependent amine dehydrogenase family protein n=1 Tax=Hyphococcus formosus TaxID=3143534 RepID=UPI00398AD1BA